MKQLFENWRRYQLNEIFTSPVPKEEITFEADKYGALWKFKVGEHTYVAELTEQALPDSVEVDPGISFHFKNYEFSFGQALSSSQVTFKPTNYGLKTGMVVMSTIISIVEEWIKNNEFWSIEAIGNGPTRIKLYKRVLKTTHKKIGSDYEMESYLLPSGTIGAFQIINVGLLEKKIDKLIQEGETRKARKLISAAIKVFKSTSGTVPASPDSSGSSTEKRIINKFNELQRIEGTIK